MGSLLAGVVSQEDKASLGFGLGVQRHLAFGGRIRSEREGSQTR